MTKPETELLKALRDTDNRMMPFMSREAVDLFYSLKTHWLVLQKRVIAGVDIFAEPEIDHKMASAGERE